MQPYPTAELFALVWSGHLPLIDKGITAGAILG
jgi:hypothetical protein